MKYASKYGRWTNPVMWLQDAIDRHAEYITKLHQVAERLQAEVDRLERVKTNKRLKVSEPTDGLHRVENPESNH